jgi:phosphoribosyl 1,2-cyclic phosphodiesterase
MKKQLKFWGTRGSCPVSGPEYQRFGGNTLCVEGRYGDAHFIIDAGTGIRPLGQALLSEGASRIHLFISHTHLDHVIGLPFFAPLYTKGFKVIISAPETGGKTSAEIIKELLSPELFPVRLDEVKADIEFRPIHPKHPIRLGDLTIDFHQTRHPGYALSFKIQTPHQKIGFATDNEFLLGYMGKVDAIPEEARKKEKSFIEFFKGADLMIHEGQYFPEEYRHHVHWGHSSVLNAAALMKEVSAPRWFSLHHDPKHTDSDLDRLASLAQRTLDLANIACKSEWVGDGHLLYLE